MGKQIEIQAERLAQIPKEAKIVRRKKTAEVVRLRIGTATYVLKWTRCNRSTCKSCPHGPYWYRTWSESGTDRWIYVGKDLRAERLMAALRTFEEVFGDPTMPMMEIPPSPLPEHRPDWIPDETWDELQVAVAGYGLSKKGRERLRLLLDINVRRRVTRRIGVRQTEETEQGEIGA